MKSIFIMAYLNLSAIISIGLVKFNDINSFSIEQSITELSDTATITLPRNYKLLNDKPVKDYINVGDKVIIEAGYEETGISNEYSGYVKEISSDVPLVIVCDEVYPFRKSNILKNYPAVSLRQLLEDTVKGIISFDGKPYMIECPDVQLGKYNINNATAFNVLTKLKTDFGFYTKIVGNLLHVGFAYDWSPSFTMKHKYVMQKNVKDRSSLKFKSVDDFNTRVTITIKHPDGNTETVSTGSTDDAAAVKSITVGKMSKVDAEKIAKARLKQYTYSGYTGSIKGFGIPKVQAGDSIEITDDEFEERNGIYLVEKVKVDYSGTGISRDCSISYKI
jgi:hypothetical protein